MSDEGQRAQKTTEEFGQMVAGHQPDRSELDEAIAWRDRFIALARSLQAAGQVPGGRAYSTPFLEPMA
jgi:hypothetical protein